MPLKTTSLLVLAAFVGFFLISCNQSTSLDTSIAPPVIAYANTPAIYVKDFAIASINVTTTGTGAIDSFTISPDLNTQTGLTFNKATGVISGTPTTTHAATAYTVVAWGPGGKGSTVVNVTVMDIAPALEAHIWLLTGFTSNPAVSLTGTGPTHVDVYDSGFASPCDKHETQTYLASGIVISSYDSAATASGCGLPDSTSIWSLNGKVVTTIDTDLFIEKDSLVTLSTTRLKVVTDVTGDDSPDGLTHTFTITTTAK